MRRHEVRVAVTEAQAAFCALVDNASRLAKPTEGRKYHERNWEPLALPGGMTVTPQAYEQNGWPVFVLRFTAKDGNWWDVSMGGADPYTTNGYANTLGFLDVLSAVNLLVHGHDEV
ncbi:MAG TPA: hypothetical protein VN778_03625 [Verrucomicrobiae bacterium]|nr:hypothetical protein [Verrucomicrobiae bacterium]